MKNTFQMNESLVTEIKVKYIISLLKSLTEDGDGVDGETMEYILEEVGMTDQMLRQLIMHNPESEIVDLLDEKVRLSELRLHDLIELPKEYKTKE